MENNRLSKNFLSYLRKLKLKKYREIESKFIIEGKHLIEECIKSKLYASNFDYIVISDKFQDKDILNKLEKKKIPFYYSSAKDLSSLSDTETPQGIIAIIKKRKPPVDCKFNFKTAVCLDRISDPGNLGTILRTCWWFNIKNVFLSPECADIYNPKVIRATQGAIFNINIFDDYDLKKGLNLLHQSGFRIFLTTSHTSDEITGTDFSNANKIIFVFGNEASGIREDILNNDDYNKIKINSFSDCESLNVSSAAAVVIGYFRLLNHRLR